MTDLNITEAGTVQFPMVRHAAEIGWTQLSPQEALRKRGGEADMLFRAELVAKLKAFNPWMTDRAIQSVIETLDALPSTIDGNSKVLAWLRGERQWYDEDEKRHRRVRLINFDAPEANVFHVTWEWKIKPLARNKGNRADVVFVVNGVPVAIVEHKNPTDPHAVDHGVTQLQRYERETPELMGTAQLFNVTHLLEYWYGVTWNISRRFMARWKEPPEETYRFAVQSFFEPNDFLRTLQDWILFYVEDGETRKSVLRQHQRRAIDKIISRCADPTKIRGLIWHTQGSGKTFTLLTAARLILERKDKSHSPTVVVVVDRTELEGQLQGWVKRLIGEMQQQDIAVTHAKSKAHLQELLQNGRRGLILSMIHKFRGLKKNANERDNVYVFIDEAHRSVAQDLGTYLMAALPKATIIGFTGTPIDKTAHGKGTFKIFGKEDEQGYLDKYTIAESIEDETTLPICYTMAPSDMRVPTEQLDKEFFELAQAEGVTDIDELNKALDRAVGLRTFLTADDRIEKVAAFVAKHFRENIKPLGYKAFLVGVNREACAKYKRALDKLLPSEWTEPIYTPNDNDSVERPLVKELQLDDEREANARMLFKKVDENPKMLIVTDKLLTGYDAPLLYCMYLDKPMRNHVLLQAIARVNRPCAANGVRKSIGLIVDFVGVLREMEKALQFDSKDVSGVIEDLDLLLRDFLAKIEKAKEDYLRDEGELDADERFEKIIAGFRTPDSRKELFETYKEIEALWEILSPSPELRDHIEIYNKLANLYVAVRNAYGNKVSYIAELANKTRDMVQDRAEQEGLGYQMKTATFDVEMINALQNKPGADEAKVIDLVRGLLQEIADKPEQSPILLPLGERAKQIQKKMEEDQLSASEAIDQLSFLAKEKDAAIKEAKVSGLSWRAYGVHQALKDDATLKAAGVSTMNLAQEAERLLNQFPSAAFNAEEKLELRRDLYTPLLQTGMATEECRQIVDRILTILLDANADHEA